MKLVLEDLRMGFLGDATTSVSPPAPVRRSSARPGARLVTGVALVAHLLGSAACHVDSLVKSGPPEGEGAPAAPGSLGQYRSDGTTAIQPGEVVNQVPVVFASTLSDPDPGDSVRLQIELLPLATAFRGVATHESGFRQATGRAVIAVAGLDSGTAYHWQARALSGAGRPSGWIAFGGNPEADADFLMAMPQPPAAPTSAVQLKSNGTTAIALGGVTDEASVVLAATVTAPDSGLVRLQVELRPVGTAFSNAVTGQSATVASGARASLTVSGLAQDAYHWQYRALDQNGRASVWTSFGGNAESAADFRVVLAQAPDAPSALGQFQSDGTTPIGVGGGTGGPTAVLQATVSDPDQSGALTLQVEARDTGTPFSDAPTHTVGGLTSGAKGSVTAAAGLAVGYHWQARTCDATGCSAWVRFGANPESDADYVGSLFAGGNQPPASPTGASQMRSDGTTPIPLGAVTDEPIVIFAGTLTDPDAGAQLRLQLEVRPLGVAFSDLPTDMSVAVASGASATIAKPGLPDTASFHWQFRAVDESGGASPWTSFGLNAESVADFVVRVPQPPRPPVEPVALAQYRSDGVTPISVGGGTSGSGAVLKARVDDPDQSGAISLEVEVRVVGTAFSNTATHTAGGLQSGNTGDVTVGAALFTGYHWQVRACDASGCSAWVAFGGNPESDADFVGTVLVGSGAR